ncbi:MAG: GAF domain-containing protein [Nitrospinota bacterium]|nr:GAF domain-containing protein [Nitrospinota bacterium]
MGHYLTAVLIRNLETLFGAVIKSGDTVISNNPSTDPRSGGIPKGHPPLNAFMGIPFFRERKLIGMIGIANRIGGYEKELEEYLQPFINTCATIVAAEQRTKNTK